MSLYGTRETTQMCQTRQSYDMSLKKPPRCARWGKRHTYEMQVATLCAPHIAHRNLPSTSSVAHTTAVAVEGHRAAHNFTSAHHGRVKGQMKHRHQLLGRSVNTLPSCLTAKVVVEACLPAEGLGLPQRMPL